MPSTQDLCEVPRKDLHVFYVPDTSSAEYNFKDLRSALLHMRRKFGLEIFRNPSRMASIINDLSPSLRRDANILRQLGNAGLLTELEQADKENWARVIFKTHCWFENELFIREEQTAYYAQVLEALYHPARFSDMPTVPQINTLNYLAEESVKILRKFEKDNGNVKLKIAVLEFHSDYRWITFNGSEILEDFDYEYLDFGGGESNLGAALRELNSKLSRHAWLSSVYNAFCPVIIFMTCGHAADDYISALEEIRKIVASALRRKLVLR